MSEQHPTALDPELGALFEAERRAPVPAERLARVEERLALSIGGLGGGGDAGSAPSASGAATASVTAWKAGLLAVGAFFVGGATGAGLLASVQKQPPEHIVYVDRMAPAAASQAIVTAPSSVAPSAVAPTPPTISPSDLPRAPSVAHSNPASAPTASSLAAERLVLDQARAALASGDAASALTTLDKHARIFPGARLAEEREALSIQALVLLGRYDEARTRADAFRQRSPRSLFLPAIDASIGSIP